MSGITKYTGKTQKNMFKDCHSITAVKFRSTVPGGTTSFQTAISEGFFMNCTSLRKIEIPGWITDIGKNAFAGCTVLTSVTLNSTPAFADATVFPDNEGQNLIIHCPDQATADAVSALNYTYTKPLYIGDLSTAMSMSGYAVRVKDYNGLRSLYSFNNTLKAANESNGYSLVEYGAVVMSADSYNKYGRELTLVNGEYVTANSEAVIKKQVYSGGEFVGNYLSTSDKKTDFAASIVNFTDNYTTDVYICGYEIWRTSTGAEVVIYTDSSNDDYDLTNLYEISIIMYRDGLVNAENDTEEIVWNTLINNGVVTLNAGTDYTYYEGQTTLDGISLANSFVFKDVPVVSQSVNSTAKTIGFTKHSSMTITMFHLGESYVAVYRGTGKVSGANAWASGAGTHQLSASFCGSYSDYPVVKLPNPKLSSTAAAKVKYVVLDYGITSASAGAFSKLGYMEKLVYSSTLKSLDGTMFTYDGSFKSAYLADVTNPAFDPSAYATTVDLSSLDSVNANYMFTTVSAVEYIHLPANIGTNASGMINQAKGLKALWCGDTTMEIGVANFTKTTVKTFGDYAFQYAKNITTVKLPVTVTALYDTSGTTKRHAFSNSGVASIYTETEVEYITSYISEFGTELGITYTHG